MADPFEVRMRFSHQLQHLNASTTSSQKAAQYALKYKDMDEDLHSCILEQLEKTSMNTRANIMYFIEHLLEMASKERNNTYVRMMQRDILRVVDGVCPEDGSGVANVKVVREVLSNLHRKEFLLEQTAIELEACLKERDTSKKELGLSSPANGDATTATDPNATRNGNGTTSSSVHKIDKRLIEQRIEEDRERHKRMRESMWVVPGNLNDEAAKSFEETSDVSDDDYTLIKEEWAEHDRDYEEVVQCGHKPPLREGHTNGISAG
ncbi:CTD kinase subunit gamma CTK3-domain-containing protein [Xylariomycetidae sp. FL2044]|nr:CTD kinase subunit gamma CTK3-domain-containing protein [Xylariomycetidae sp. FL2044]